MMTLIRNIAITLSAFAFISCSKFDDINTSPDSSTQVKSSLLATGAIAGIVKPSTGATFVDHLFITKYLGWGEGSRGAQYNDFYRTSFSDYTSLMDYQTMADLAPEGQEEAYQGLALLFKAYRLYNQTIAVGDIPYSEILKGDEGLYKPKYDTQKDVFLYLLEDLDNAYANLSVANDFDGDFIFDGNAKKWAKITTAIRLRLLINLSKKESDTDLRVADRFRQVYENGMLMESNDDNLQLKFSDKSGQFYPFHSSQNKHWAYAMVSDFMVNMLKKHEDYRLFYYAKPAQQKLDEGLEAGDWDAFVGVDPTAPISEIKEKFAISACSGLNERYINYISGEPFIQVGYAEQNFILAEAALRGWISGDPNEFYLKGIRASMEFIANNTPDDAIYHYGHSMTQSYIDAFLAKESVQLKGSFDEQLNMIMEQKYIAGFMQLPYQAYYDYRRTGYPVLPINPETSLNFNAPDKLPVRWQYPDTEISYNTENVEEAIERQYGSDEVNKLMWILK